MLWVVSIILIVYVVLTEYPYCNWKKKLFFSQIKVWKFQQPPWCKQTEVIFNRKLYSALGRNYINCERERTNHNGKFNSGQDCSCKKSFNTAVSGKRKYKIHTHNILFKYQILHYSRHFIKFNDSIDFSRASFPSQCQITNNKLCNCRYNNGCLLVGVTFTVKHSFGVA